MLKLRIKGIALEISVLFFAAAVVWLTMDPSHTAALCLLASLMHELGHLGVMLYYGLYPKRIAVGLFGVRMEQQEGVALGYRQQIWLSLAGPAVNLAVGGGLWLIIGFGTAAAVNLLLAAMNLLPIQALDGGQALYCYLAGRMEEPRAQRIVFVISMAVLLPLATAGFFLLIRSGYNFTLLAACIYLILLLFLRPW